MEHDLYLLQQAFSGRGTVSPTLHRNLFIASLSNELEVGVEVVEVTPVKMDIKSPNKNYLVERQSAVPRI